VFIFAHLRKCAGSSVVRSAIEAGLVLPSNHLNGHPAGPDGHALPGMAGMTGFQIETLIRSERDAGVGFMAIEWDFPRMELLPTSLELKLFTIFRDPVERFVSGFSHDLISGYTEARTWSRYLGSAGIWTAPNYYTRFFSALKATDAVGSGDCQYAAEAVASRCRFAFVGDDLRAFLIDVGLPIRQLRHDNRTSRVGKLLHRSRLSIGDADMKKLRDANALDYRLIELLRERSRQEIATAEVCPGSC
jgi:hypothetical protein